jgi:hypothetical protein
LAVKKWLDSKIFAEAISEVRGKYRETSQGGIQKWKQQHGKSVRKVKNYKDTGSEG